MIPGAGHAKMTQIAETGVEIAVGSLIATCLHEWTERAQRKVICFFDAVALSTSSPATPADDPRLIDSQWKNPCRRRSEPSHAETHAHVLGGRPCSTRGRYLPTRPLAPNDSAPFGVGRSVLHDSKSSSTQRTAPRTINVRLPVTLH